MTKNKIIVLIISLIIILGLIIRTYCFSNNEVPEVEKKEEISENSEEVVETPLLVKIEEPETEQQPENQAEQTNDSKPTTKKYKASNGKSYDSIGNINIPKLGINYPILATTTEQTLKVAVTTYWGGNPNEVGNLCVSGHNYKNSKFFGKLLNIKNGDTIQISDLNGKTLNYKVYDTFIVDPQDTSCTSQLTNGKIEVTLITCYYENGNAHATKRFIVKARVE